LRAWRGVIAMQLALTQGEQNIAYPDLQTEEIETSGLKTKDQREDTARLSMTVLFMLMMMLAGMVLSNLVEEKANKIIEILAAALPMDAVFMGKLFAMLAVSLCGIFVAAIVKCSRMRLSRALAGRSSPCCSLSISRWAIC